ncbi:phosphodiesterase [Butyrivibrio sp. NC3005]|uniref:phosphodiesterase n=1 Tax=Butyrivibrio sp. NC3005 TaxID=1280685 RepID=UPI000403FAA7|nr:phosphodiesterase [Butyrivibrio sp. NC3005]
MKFMIASDIHGSFYYCNKMIEAFKRENADRLILLGDILYHGPRNDLPKDYAPKKVISLLNEYKDYILCVRGNCDTEVDQMVLEFPIMADYAILNIGERIVYMTHGHVFNKNNLPPLRKNDILLHGHTHIPVCEELKNGVLYINPGSVSIPKNESPNSYIILEDNTFVWKTLDGEGFDSKNLTMQ